MTGLATRSNSSLTRMSHVVTRLEARGIVARSACAADGRATNVTITPAGHDLLVAAAPGHVTQVRESFLDALNPEQLEQLDVPRLHLPTIADGVDLGSLYELSEILARQGVR